MRLLCCLQEMGFDTYATMRNVNKSEEIIDISKKDNLPLQLLELDITSDKSVVNAVDKILRERKELML